MVESALHLEQPVAVALASANRLLVQRLRNGVVSPLSVVGEAAHVREIVALARRDGPDLVLVDVAIPGGVVEATRELVDRALGTVVLVAGEPPGDALMLRALRAGAVGLIAAATPSARLGPTLLGALRGEAALTRTQVGRLLSEFQARPGRSVVSRGRRVHLTQRELEVFQHLRANRGTAATANLLGIAPTTVRTHVASLLRKARVSTREELVRVFSD